MGAFLDLRIDPDTFREVGGSDVFDKSYSNTDLKAVKLIAAQNQLLTDLGDALGLNINDSDDLTTIDDTVTEYESQIRTALMYSQLCWFYNEAYNDLDGQKYQRRLDFCSAYQEEKSKFPGYTIGETSSTTRLLRFVRG